MLSYQLDPVRPGIATISSQSAPQLAEAVEALTARLAAPGDQLACHARHYNEQDGSAHGSYPDELAVLGREVRNEVIVVARPYRPNVVWLDRFHLVAAGANPACIGQLFGLYAGSRGDLTTVVYPPASSSMAMHTIWQVPFAQGRPDLGSQLAQSGARIAARYSESTPGVVELAVTPAIAQALAQALSDPTLLRA